MTSKIYAVTNTGNPVARVRLVRAENRQQARNHVVRDTIHCDLASQETLVDAIKRGVVIEAAGDISEPDAGGAG